MKFRTQNPYNNKVAGTYKTHKWKQVEAMLARSVQGAAAVANAGFGLRGEKMEALAGLLHKRRDELAGMATLEMGKPIAQARAELDKCAGMCRFYIREAESLLAPETKRLDGVETVVQYEPLGVVLAVMPWNFPFWQVLRCAVPAIMAGNAVLLKHAPNVPGCALAIESLFAGAGFDQGVFQNLFIPEKRVKRLLEDDRVQAVSFTGSDAGGAAVAAIAGANVKKSVLELGGSDPFVVLDDADLEAAAKAAVQSRMLNNGQSCIAAKRWIVTQRNAAEFTGLTAALVRGLKVGDPAEGKTDIGPLARHDLLHKLENQVQVSLQMGAKALVGGYSPAKHGGAFFQPTLLVDVREDMPVCREEVFGPVASILVAEDEAEALRMANNTPYGLGASVWTCSKDKARWWGGKLRAGSVFVNGITKSDARLPFGGIKKSGYGRELAAHGIREFANVKTVSINL